MYLMNIKIASKNFIYIKKFKTIRAMKLLTSLFAFLIFLLASQPTVAQGLSPQMFASSSNFETLIAIAQTQCPNLDCESSLKIHVLTSSEVAELSPVDQKKVIAAVDHLNQIWGDTILEGDFEVFGEAQLNQVAAVLADGKLLGYRLHFSQKASDLMTQDKGFIQERGFVSVMTDEIFPDETFRAHFVAQ
jgi:hypothetical protein